MGLGCFGEVVVFGEFAKAEAAKDKGDVGAEEDDEGGARFERVYALDEAKHGLVLSLCGDAF